MPDRGLEHGGDLDEAVLRYGIPRAQWLDLSTGINPTGYPVPEVPESAWHRLPTEGDGLSEAASGYYGTVPLLPVPGSQAAVSLLPYLWRSAAVGIVEPTYGEHGAAWREAGHQVEGVAADDLDKLAGNFDIIVLCNPNNPDSTRWPPERLEALREDLAGRGGWLIVDEAFVDPHPELSVIGYAGNPGLVVLRSLGKFFGLAGARIGFAAGPLPLLRRLDRKQGPWAVSGPTRTVAAQALDDRHWQRQMREQLPQAADRLQELLEHTGLPPAGGTALFQYVPCDAPRAWQKALARRGIWVRAFDEPPALRVGLAGTEAEWTQLEEALRAVAAEDPGR